ncbi:MAG TPA: caspase family protein [Pyrinomonadaceae bacterium]
MSPGGARVRKLSSAFCLLLAAAQLFAPPARTQERDDRTGRGRDALRDEVKRDDVNTLAGVTSLYGESHALVVGISEYEHWRPLPGVKVDVPEVERALKQRGFAVEVAKNEDLGSDRLHWRILDFIARHGGERENRLLIYYAGHGHRHRARDGSEEGFIVPKDAPLPEDGASEPPSKVVSMRDLLESIKGAESKHVLFVLDSCYGGSLINAADAGAVEPRFVEAVAAAREEDPDSSFYVPPHIRAKVRERARQIIASGTYKQQVPDDSEFRKKFVAGLTDESGGGADLDGDSYVTAPELGEYLQSNVARKSNGSQQPVWGFIGSKAANPGDFVFVMPGATAKEVTIDPPFDPALWDVPKDWSLDKSKSLLDAPAPDLMLPRRLVRHSFRDFESVTRLRLKNNTAANLVLRARNRRDYYLIQLTGGRFPARKAQFLLRAWVVRDGRAVTELAGSPVPVKDPMLEQRVSYRKALQVVVTARDNRFTVKLQSGEGKDWGLLLLLPVVFIDPAKTYRYGAPGFLVEDGQRLQLLSVHVYKLKTDEKGRT